MPSLGTKYSTKKTLKDTEPNLRFRLAMADRDHP